MAKPKATTTSVKPTTTTAPERSEEPKITVSSDDGGSGGWGWGVVAARGVALLGGAGAGTMSRRANRSGLRRPTLVGILLGAAMLVAGCGEAGVTLGQSKDSTSAWTAASPRSSLCSAWDSRPTWTGSNLSWTRQMRRHRPPSCPPPGRTWATCRAGSSSASASERSMVSPRRGERRSSISRRSSARALGAAISGQPGCVGVVGRGAAGLRRRGQDCVPPSLEGVRRAG